MRRELMESKNGIESALANLIQLSYMGNPGLG